MDLLTVAVACIYLQPLLWMILYSKNVPIPPRLVQAAGLVLALVLAVLKIGSGFYTTEILVFYALSVVYCIHYYRERPGFQPVCLAMLAIFVNSYYWEFPIHVGNLLGGYVGLVLFQSIHLYPVPFLLTLGFKFPRRWWYWSVAAWSLITALALAKLYLAPSVSMAWVNLVCRAIGLLTLTWILRFPGQGENRIISKVRQLLGRYDRPPA